MRLTETQLEALNSKLVLKAKNVRYENVCKRGFVMLTMEYKGTEFKADAVIKDGKIVPDSVGIYNPESYNEGELPSNNEMNGYVELLIEEYL